MRQSQASKGRGNLSEKSCPGTVRARIHADSVVVTDGLPTPAGLFGGFRGCCLKLVWAAVLAVELCGFCGADARTAYSHRLVRCFQ